MSPRKPLKTKEITELLTKLKAETPDYPSELMAAKKAAFLKQAVNIKIDGKGHGGEGGQQGGGSGSGGSGAALSGGTAAPNILLQALIGISIVAGMFLAAYAYRDQINEIMRGNGGVTRNESSQPSIVSTPLATEVPGFVSPAIAVPSSESMPAEILEENPGDMGSTEINGASVVQGTPAVESASEKDKTNSGLHLGQTPGTPAAPGQGNPGNPNQPVKDKPTKPDKPDNPNKPDKPKKTK